MPRFPKDRIDLPSLDDLFTTQEERDDAKREKVYDIEPSKLYPFPEHPFNVKMDDDMRRLVDSIKERGVLIPIIARQIEEDKYQIVSGHRRATASGLAGLETLPVLVRDLSDDESTIIMVDSNLQREEILPSERAFAYKMKLDAIKRQGKRTDLEIDNLWTSGPQVEKTSDLIGQETNESGRQIRRYIRLTNLIQPLLDMVDNKSIAFRPAVELSYLANEEQNNLHSTMTELSATPSLSQAIQFKKLSQKGELTSTVILEMLASEKPNQKEKIYLLRDKVEPYIPRNITNATTEEYIIKALEFYRKAMLDKNKNKER